MQDFKQHNKIRLLFLNDCLGVVKETRWENGWLREVRVTCLGCHNKIPIKKWLTKNGDVFLQVPEAGETEIKTHVYRPVSGEKPLAGSKSYMVEGTKASLGILEANPTWTEFKR